MFKFNFNLGQEKTLLKVVEAVQGHLNDKSLPTYKIEIIRNDFTLFSRLLNNPSFEDSELIALSSSIDNYINLFKENCENYKNENFYKLLINIKTQLN